mmetsp:Transcript_6371/g.8289  ORF Transcript_6371/g.8289 Transcript_6371/m.8289 type:complete len:130 (-) Transcript_6371:432-821(-)
MTTKSGDEFFRSAGGLSSVALLLENIIDLWLHELEIFCAQDGTDHFFVKTCAKGESALRFISLLACSFFGKICIKLLKLQKCNHSSVRGKTTFIQKTLQKFFQRLFASFSKVITLKMQRACSGRNLNIF